MNRETANMILTQEQLDEPILDIYGGPVQIDDDRSVTIRFLMVESILQPAKDRAGDDKLKGYHMANKVNLPHGNLTLEPDEVKFIMDRVDKKEWSDYLYGIIHEAFGKAKMQEIPKEDAKEG